MEKSVGEESCREVLGRSVVETCWKRVLEKRVGEEGCREESCREVLEKSVVEKAVLEKSARRVGCCSFFAVADIHVYSVQCLCLEACFAGRRGWPWQP